MSRLYCFLTSDKLKTTHTARAHKSLSLKVNYGSKDDSKELCSLHVDFLQDQETPHVAIKLYALGPEDLEIFQKSPMIEFEKKTECPLGDMEKCQHPLERFLSCSACDKCPKANIRRLNTLLKKET